MTKYPYADSTRAIDDYSVGTVDGQTKVLIMYSIIAICYELDIKELGALADTLRSFRYIRCGYQHFDEPSHHFLHSLSFLAWIPCHAISEFGFLKLLQWLACLSFNLAKNWATPLRRKSARRQWLYWQIWAMQLRLSAGPLQGAVLWLYVIYLPKWLQPTTACALSSGTA